MKNLVRHLFVLPVRMYQYFISPALPPACRFYPTCSDYAAEAVLRHGALRGAFLALRRLARCHPFGGYGYDPVPPAKRLSSRAETDKPAPGRGRDEFSPDRQTASGSGY
ncbi:MAG: membrane protein insertion efficiency factor YidD [Desulfovibrio sp.]|jgi:putative membrane protein insertion efficiency factor|nr:membrane protein insertion efficiency factor YidD [Desulfovibrio sp.]